MSTNIIRPTVDRYHALLFVGVCNRERYVLSLLRWTDILNQMYGYPIGNIRIIVGPYSDPSWAPMRPGTDITYNATRTDLDNALAAYATGSGDPHELGTDDSLFIFTFNHGGNDITGSYLCCDSFTTQYYASDFAARISAIHCRQIVLLAAQCNSGGFVDPFINALWANTRGAVMAGSRSDQTTYEAVCDKLFGSAFNGRMVQDALDDNIDIGITGDGIGIYTVPGYNTDRVDWGPTGVISTREAFNRVYDHYVNRIYPDPSYAAITEIPLYDQKPWIESGQPLHICLGEPDLVMQDCNSDIGEEPSICSEWWYSPDLYADNTDLFPTVGQHQYVPAHHNRFFIRTANRGTAPTDDIWRCMEVRGLGFTGGPVGPPRIDRASETSSGITASARLRPGRAHTQYERILIGGDFGHGCISAATWCGTDPMSHPLWSIKEDNDQVQCNLDPASVSGSVPVDAGSVNTNAGKFVQIIPIVADATGTFEIRVGRPSGDVPLDVKVDKRMIKLERGQMAQFKLEIGIKPGTKDGAKAQVSVTFRRSKKVIGGMSFLITTATAFADVAIYNQYGLIVGDVKVLLTQPGDPRELIAETDKGGIAHFGPLNPGFYFAKVKGIKEPMRIFVAPGNNHFKLTLIDKKIAIHRPLWMKGTIEPIGK